MPPHDGNNPSGLTTVYRLKEAPGDIAALPDVEGGVSVPAPALGLDFAGTEPSQCAAYGDWVFLGENFGEACAKREICLELEIVQACEGTVSDAIVGKYTPYDGECEDADKTKSVYKSIHATNSDGDDFAWIFFETESNGWVATFGLGSCGS